MPCMHTLLLKLDRAAVPAGDEYQLRQSACDLARKRTKWAALVPLPWVRLVGTPRPRQPAGLRRGWG